MLFSMPTDSSAANTWAEFVEDFMWHHSILELRMV